ncbi:YceI family protein [Ravibacter arvi]|uniref:YceI family protein n=1 Tax=Ravibacter arvi TaxID=2051041 RepID=A0ABP8LZD5_9BACT
MKDLTKNLLCIAIFPLSVWVSSCEKENGSVEMFRVNESASSIEWKGSAPDHFHIGSFKTTGELKAGKNGEVKSGDFTIPISSIENFDLPDPVKQQLLDHLKSPDFFNIALHPTAKFQFTKSAPYDGKSEGAIAGANFMLTGNFTMLGQTHPISFPAKITVSEENLTAEANLKIDRTKWGMTFDSDPEQPLYIFPDVELKLKLVARKNN